MESFRAMWQGRLTFNSNLGIILILLFGIPRFLLVLTANSGGNYSMISILFVAMWITPFLLLNKAGRRVIGLKGIARRSWLVWAPLAGIGAGLLVFLLGWICYGMTIDNWYVYIGRTYIDAFPPGSGLSPLTKFGILACIAMTFSPLGEEFLYRGVIHQCFVPGYGEQTASRIDSLAFAVTHLSHFGILYLNGYWEFHVGPALLWMGCMYVSSRLFFLCRQGGGTLLAAVLCHAGFNLAMTYVIWFHIMD